MASQPKSSAVRQPIKKKFSSHMMPMSQTGSSMKVSHFKPVLTTSNYLLSHLYIFYYIRLTFIYHIYMSIYSHIYISSHQKHINDSPYDSSDHIFCWFMIEACTNQFSVSTPATHLQLSTTSMTYYDKITSRSRYCKRHQSMLIFSK